MCAKQFLANTVSAINTKWRTTSLKFYKNWFLGPVPKSPTQIGSLIVKDSATNISRLGTFRHSLCSQTIIYYIYCRVWHSPCPWVATCCSRWWDPPGRNRSGNTCPWPQGRSPPVLCAGQDKTGLRIRIRINLSCWIRIRIKEGKNDPQKKEKGKKFHVWIAGCSLLRAEASPVAWASLMED